ncbi:MAG: (2Fe-2S)-binding protein [Oscillospiraceae bacterium]|nr:(2Fe-2S)-binding protein [Oscillospiraceae bacterium]
MEEKKASVGARVTQEAAAGQAAAAINSMPAALTTFRCPLDGRVFASYADLVDHYNAEHPDSVVPITVNLTINGKNCEILLEPHWTLKQALQFKLGLTGAKHMCDRGACGSCTVIMDGRPILSCQILAAECEGFAIQTVEGIAADPKWKPLIDAYCKWDAMQCGYCTPGFLVTAKCLLDRNPHPTETEIKKALSGNICICGTYPRHSQAILEAAEIIGKEGN